MRTYRKSAFSKDVHSYPKVLWMAEDPVGSTTVLRESRAPRPNFGWRGAVAGKTSDDFAISQNSNFARKKFRVGTPTNPSS
ncbi:hypothetical protein DLM75_23090 [Leptospira stimsonii]|uniref:Uncharacterized protein n=1 Tax=Leptospira stimsonii TaxID=2202203 RepID=A0A396YM85_9LEPT|nr:hypothetical protein DLM75_23090 [Leptospira stimsonii]